MHSNLCVYCCNICDCLLQVFPPLGCVSLPDLSLYPNQPPSQKWAQILCTQICVFNCTCLSTSIPTPRVCQSAWLVMLSQPAPQPEVGAITMHSNLDVYCCLTSRFVYFHLVCHQKFPPLGCVRLTDLHVIYQRIGQNGCNCTQIWVVYYSLTPKFASLYLLSVPITLYIEEITPFGVCSKIYLP